MIDFSLSEIADITGGELFKPPDFTGQNIKQIITDSRSFHGGKQSLFFALTGPRNNGHYFISDVIKKGGAAFIISDKKFISDEASFVLVENTTNALHQLAAFNRKKFNCPVVGITGSNGKTIVKEWLFDLLSGDYKIVRSPKSYNSQTGVPLSVLLTDKNYDLAIFEAGISQPGEMKNLQKIIQPELGILTNIGDAHQENFNSRLQKLREKLTLFNPAKQLVFCADEKDTAAEIKKFCTRNNIEPCGWSLQNRDEPIYFQKEKKETRTTIWAFIHKKKFSFTIPFTDDSSIENACHCFAAVTLLHGKTETVLPRFSSLAPVEMRLELKKGINNCLLINDFYNSDLTSLSIALSVLHQQAQKEHLKKLVILSDIRQTGLPPDKLYDQVNQLMEQWQTDEIIGIGPDIAGHSQTFSIPGKFYPSTNKFTERHQENKFHNAAILMKGARVFEFEKIAERLQQKAHQTVLEINLSALTHNLNVFRGLLNPGTKIMVMVKAFSYGSGDVEIARLLQFQNVDYLAVAVADEGVELRKAGIETPVIVMNPEQHSFRNIIEYRLEPNIYDTGLLDQFEKVVASSGLQEYPIHLKTDTGMNRLGFKTETEIDKLVVRISNQNHLKIQSVFSHLAGSDSTQFDTFTGQQFDQFEQLSQQIISAFHYKIDRHILNSAGIERFPEKQMEMVRLGIGLYGISVSGLPLENISTFKSTISQVKTIQKGDTVGYGRAGKISRKSKIAVVPVGYADGLDRKLSNGNGEARVNGSRVPVTGTICMDMLMLDVTNVNAKPGDAVEFFGPHISVSEVAEKAGTIPYEILTGISQRVKRVYLYE